MTSRAERVLNWIVLNLLNALPLLLVLPYVDTRKCVLGADFIERYAKWMVGGWLKVLQYMLVADNVIRLSVFWQANQITTADASKGLRFSCSTKNTKKWKAEFE